jgi:methyltransferase (TIGR00027 family)
VKEISPQNNPSSERTASQTALGAARLRAAHLLLDDPPAILSDTVALLLLDPGADRAIRDNADRFHTPASRTLRCDVVVRSRFAEDRLEEAVRRGVRQYVILGAGLDTFAYRAPAWARDLRIFEVDHPASQADKQARQKRAGIATPPNALYVAADLEAGDLASVLRTAGIDAAQPTFFACLGVLIYLSDAAADTIFTMTAGFAPGSEFVFSFSRPDASTASPPFPGSAAARVADLGEPWRTRFEPDALVARLKRAGFGTVGLLFSGEVTERYLAGRNDRLRAATRVVLADVTV